MIDNYKVYNIMAFSQTYKEGLVVQLGKVQVIEEKQAYLWKKDLTSILSSKTIKVFKFLAGKKIKRILDIAEDIVQLIAFIQALGGWENFKNVILKIIEVGGLDETIKKLDNTPAPKQARLSK